MDNPVKKILLIEDSESDAFSIQRAFRDFPFVESYSLVRLRSMAEARQYELDHSGESCPVILLDLGLPDTVDANDTYKQIREIYPYAAIIALTSISDHFLALDLIREGVEDYIDKAQLVSNPEILRRAIDYCICRSDVFAHSMRKMSNGPQKRSSPPAPLNSSRH